MLPYIPAKEINYWYKRRTRYPLLKSNLRRTIKKKYRMIVKRQIQQQMERL